MKWFVLLLVLANAGVFLWFTVNEPENVRSLDEGKLPRVAEIELVLDQNQDEAEQLAPANIIEDSARVASAPDAVTESRRERTAGENEEGPEEVDDPAQGLTRQCFGIGWFEESEQASDYRQRLKRAHSDIDTLGITEKVTPLEDFHWVLIPPMDSREAAMARYRELVERGIEAYVVPTGENVNAISLGLFRSRRSAEELLSRRQAENIDAVLANFPRNRISYALVFEGLPDRSLLARNGAPAGSDGELQLIEFSDCEGVATAEKNP